MVPFGGVLEPFLKDLPADTGFHHAAKWDPSSEGQEPVGDAPAPEPEPVATPAP